MPAQIPGNGKLLCTVSIRWGLLRRPFENAFATQREASPEPTAAGRKRKLTAKGKSRYVDPSSSRADYILEKGGLSLEEDE